MDKVEDYKVFKEEEYVTREVTSATSNGFPTALMNTFVFTASSSNSYSSYNLPGDVGLHLVHLPVLHLLHLLFHHHLIIIQHLPNRQEPTTNTIVATGIRFDPEFYS